MPTLAAQVRHSIVSTMAGNAPSDRAVEAIAAFVQQLPQPPNLVAARRELGTSTSKSETRELAAGQALFRKLSCAECHAGDWFTSQETFDVAMHDENSMTHFNPPSLVSASQRQNSLFHDARAKSFRDVLIQEKHQLSSALSEPEVRALIRYLESL